MFHHGFGCLQVKYADANLLLPTQQLLGNSAEATMMQAPIVEQFVSAPLPRSPGLPLVDDWDCLRVCPPWLISLLSFEAANAR